MVVVFVLIIGRASRGPAVTPPAAPFASGTGGGAPPDLSQLSPRERFDRLYNRVMEAAERGDTAEMARFTPMALLAYGMLDSLDADARYHAALLQLHSGGVEAAAALGDSILAATPGHLFGYVVQATIAKWRGDQATLRRAYQEFNRHVEEELARPDRPEYEQHRQVIEAFRTEAAAGAS